MPTLTVSVIIAAGGAGRRFAVAAGKTRNGVRSLKDRAPDPLPPLPHPEPLSRLSKVFMLLAGRPVLAHTLERFAAVESVAEVIVAVPAACIAEAQERFGQTLSSGRPLIFVAGGEDRVASVALALAVTDPKTGLVAIHDAVRPLIRPAVIREVLRAAAEHGGAVAGRPVDHTVKRIADGRRIVETVPRERLWVAQTPQAFRRDVIVRAYAERARAGPGITDDAQLVESLGLEVVMVQCDAANLKITTPEDLRLCEALLAAGWPFM